MAGDATLAPRPDLTYVLPDSKKCGTTAAACVVPKDLNAGGDVTSTGAVTARGGVNTDTMTAINGPTVTARVTQALDANHAMLADRATQADQADRAALADAARWADAAARANQAAALAPGATVNGSQIIGPVTEALNSRGGGGLTYTIVAGAINCPPGYLDAYSFGLHPSNSLGVDPATGYTRALCLKVAN